MHKAIKTLGLVALLATGCSESPQFTKISELSGTNVVSLEGKEYSVEKVQNQNFFGIKVTAGNTEIYFTPERGPFTESVSVNRGEQSFNTDVIRSNAIDLSKSLIDKWYSDYKSNENSISNTAYLKSNSLHQAVLNDVSIKRLAEDSTK